LWQLDIASTRDCISKVMKTTEVLLIANPATFVLINHCFDREYIQFSITIYTVLDVNFSVISGVLIKSIALESTGKVSYKLSSEIRCSWRTDLRSEQSFLWFFVWSYTTRTLWVAQYLLVETAQYRNSETIYFFAIRLPLIW
jgi:hypothetical protein